MRAQDQEPAGTSRSQPRRTATRSADPAPAHPAAPLTPQAILHLQRTVGNAAVAQLLDGNHAPVQRSTVPDVLRGAGTPMDGPLRAEMETRLGADFSDVRLHTGTAAERSAAEIGARAYTAGSHVVLGEPSLDKHTLAHELTHVIQQREGPVEGTARADGLRVSDPSDRFERAAEANATRVMRAPTTATNEHDHVGAGPATGTDVQRFRQEQTSVGVEMTVTDGGAFAITPGADHIWVRDGHTTGLAPAMQPDGRKPNSMKIGETTYTRYRLARVKILEDCLHAAEEIINNRVGELAYGQGEYSQVEVHTGEQNPPTRLEDFGAGIDEIRQHAADFARPRDYNADAQPGEAFVIVTETRGERIMSPYHAAAVVARDGRDCITLEVFATGADNPPKGSPAARSYTVGDAEHSFHGYWTTAYFHGTGPVTVVIQSHPDQRA